MLTARTVLLGVLGWPVAHSLSPAMHNAALRALGLDWAYAAFAVPPAQLADAVRGAGALGLRGLNVTLPHKEAALGLCVPDALARRVGAVNTLCFGPDATTGHNTDVAGFVALCAAAGAQLQSGRRAVVLGAGGAARAVTLALRDRGLAVRLFARTPRSLLLDGELVPVEPLRAAVLAPLLGDCDLLVDCTPRGLGADPERPEEAYPELDLQRLPPHAVVLDLTVRRRTALCALAARYGLQASAGGPMLLHQGAAALALWRGGTLPAAATAAMAAALAAALAAA